MAISAFHFAFVTALAAALAACFLLARSHSAATISARAAGVSGGADGVYASIVR